MDRVDKINYYLDIAETVSKRGTCLRNNYGSVIVKNDEIISTGYTGAPRGRANCIDLGVCRRKQNNTPSKCEKKDNQIKYIKKISNSKKNQEY